MRINGKILAALCRIPGRQPLPALEHVVVRGPVLQLTDLETSVRFMVHDAADEGAEFTAPIPWLAGLARTAGARKCVELAPSEHDVNSVTATVGKVGYKNYGMPVVDMPPVPELPDRPVYIPLAPSDWSKGGAVNVAAHCASSDWHRPHVNAVHLSSLVSATDGHKLSRRKPVADMSGLDLLLPLRAAQAMTALTGATAPRAMRATKDGAHVWFLADCGAYSWVLACKIPDATPPPYESIEKQCAEAAETETAIEIGLDDLHAFAAVYKHDRAGCVAVYADGSLLAWGKQKDGIPERSGSSFLVYPTTIATNLTEYPNGAPIVVLGFANLAGVLKTLPKTGAVTMRVVQTEISGKPMPTAIIAGETLMPMRGEVPLKLVAESFGVPYVPPAAETEEEDAASAA